MAESTVPATTETRQPAQTREEERFLIPPVDIYETDNYLAVVADLPGVDKQGVDVRVEDDVLTIKGRADHQRMGEETLTEYELRSFYRQFRLGDQIDREKIEASMKHGVLTVRLPKAEKAAPKQITVNAS